MLKQGLQVWGLFHVLGGADAGSDDDDDADSELADELMQDYLKGVAWLTGCLEISWLVLYL